MVSPKADAADGGVTKSHIWGGGEFSLKLTGWAVMGTSDLHNFICTRKGRIYLVCAGVNLKGQLRKIFY